MTVQKSGWSQVKREGKEYFGGAECLHLFIYLYKETCFLAERNSRSWNGRG